MSKLSILNSKAIKRIRQMVMDQWGTDIPGTHVFLENEKGRIFLVSSRFGQVSSENMRIQSIGAYFAEISHNEIRLSIEGSQLIGPTAAKNVLELDDAEGRAWISGETLEKEGDQKGFLLVKNGNDFLGTGKFSGEKFLNYVPKSRRINVIE